MESGSSDSFVSLLGTINGLQGSPGAEGEVQVDGQARKTFSTLTLNKVAEPLGFHAGTGAIILSQSPFARFIGGMSKDKQWLVLSNLVSGIEGTNLTSLKTDLGIGSATPTDPWVQSPLEIVNGKIAIDIAALEGSLRPVIQPFVQEQVQEHSTVSVTPWKETTEPTWIPTRNNETRSYSPDATRLGVKVIAKASLKEGHNWPGGWEDKEAQGSALLLGLPRSVSIQAGSELTCTLKVKPGNLFEIKVNQVSPSPALDLEIVIKTIHL